MKSITQKLKYKAGLIGHKKAACNVKNNGP